MYLHSNLGPNNYNGMYLSSLIELFIVYLIVPNTYVYGQALDIHIRAIKYNYIKMVLLL